MVMMKLEAHHHRMQELTEVCDARAEILYT
jgi:hypothetical protein